MKAKARRCLTAYFVEAIYHWLAGDEDESMRCLHLAQGWYLVYCRPARPEA